MKKVFLTLTVMMVVISLFVLLVSCGDTPAETSALTSGTSAETSAVSAVATVGETTGNTPDNKLPDNTDYSKAVGTRFEFSLAAESYYGTEYNAQGNPIIRRVYDFETMLLDADPVFFAYEYDAKGVLKGYSVKVNPFNQQTSLSLTYDENGRAVSGEAKNGNEGVSVSWEYDQNGVIVCETMELNGYVITFTYDDKGRLVKETAEAYGNIAECVNTYTAGSMHQKATMDDETVVDADYTFDEEGYPLTVKGLVGDDVDISYTYNEKKLCTLALIKGQYGNYKVEATYNAKDLVASITSTFFDEDGVKTYKYVKEYLYDDQERVASQTSLTYNAENVLEDKSVYIYQYDAKNNLSKEEYQSFNSEGKMDRKNVNSWVYDDANRLVEQTYTEYNASGAITEKESFAYEYDANDNCVKETNKFYTPDGALSETRITEFTYDSKNLLIKTEEKHYQGDALVYHEIKEYDENGDVTKRIDYHVDKENVSSKVGRTEEAYTYGDDGYICQSDRREYDADGKLTARYVTEYKDGMLYKITEYDADGNVMGVQDFSDKN